MRKSDPAHDRGDPVTFFDSGVGGPGLRLHFDGYGIAIVFLLLGWEFGWQKVRYFWLCIPFLIHSFFLSATPYGDLGFRLTTFGCVMAATFTYILGRVGRKIFGGGAKLSFHIFRRILETR